MGNSTTLKMTFLRCIFSSSGVESSWNRSLPPTVQNSPPFSAGLKHTNPAYRGAWVPTISLCIPTT